MRKIETIRNLSLIALCPAIVTMGLTVANYYSISSDSSYSMVFELKSVVDDANVTTVTGIGVEAQILNLDKASSKDEATSESGTKADTDITRTIIYNSLAGDINTWNGRISADDFKKYQDDLTNVNGVIVNSVVDKEGGTVTYTFKNGQAIVSDSNMKQDVTQSYSHDIPEDDAGETEQVDEHTTKTTYKNGVVKTEIMLVDGIDAPTDDDLNNKPIKLNYKIKWGNIGICYLCALGIEGIAYGIYIGIKKLKIYFQNKNKKGS